MNLPNLDLLPTREEVEGLKAQVQQLRSAIKYCTSYLEESNLNSIGHKSKAHSELVCALMLTAPQCLAEVRAQAVEDAILKFVDFVIDNDLSNALDAAAWRFNQIRQQTKQG